MSTTKADPEIVSTRTCFDGATIYLHADGSVSFRNYFCRGKLPVAQMWRAWGDICLYTSLEVPALIKAVRNGTWRPFRIRPSIDHEAILAKQVRTMGFNQHGWLVRY